jgi:hypothetical protein
MLVRRSHAFGPALGLCDDRLVTDPRWERYAAAAGLGAAALLALQMLVAPLYPWVDDQPIRILAYYSANASAIRVQILLGGLAGILFLWWIGSLRVHLRRAEEDPGRLSAVAFGSAIAAVGIAAFGGVATLAAVNGPAPAAGAVPFGAGLPMRTDIAAIPFHELRLDSYTISWFALAPMLASVAVVAARDGAFPRWHMNASYALAILSLGTGLSVLIDTGPFAPGGVFTLVLYGGFVLWLGATSWLLMRTFESAGGSTRASRPSPAETERLSPGSFPAAPPESDITPHEMRGRASSAPRRPSAWRSVIART